MPKKKKNGAAQTTNPAKSASQARIKQSSMPYYALRDSLAIARSLYYDFGGAPSAPAAICPKVHLSPASSRWRDRLGASNAYGLTEGLWNAETIALTPLGRRVVAPRDEQDAIAAAKEAVMLPEFLANFYAQYDGNTLPEPAAVEQLMRTWNLPPERAAKAYAVIRENGEAAGLLREKGGAVCVSLAGTPAVKAPAEPAKTQETPAAPAEPEHSQADALEGTFTLPPLDLGGGSRVFLLKGKDEALLDNLKTLLEFGSFEPVLPPDGAEGSAADSENLFESMRKCGAAIICIEDELTAVSAAGGTRCLLPETVQLTLGAAIALCGDRTILLCRRGIALPTYLQGLHRCVYDGGRLDYEATMKLLKIFNSFKSGGPA